MNAPPLRRTSARPKAGPSRSLSLASSRSQASIDPVHGATASALLPQTTGQESTSSIKSQL